MSRIGNKASYDGAMLRRFLPSKVDRYISIGRWRLKVIFKRTISKPSSSCVERCASISPSLSIGDRYPAAQLATPTHAPSPTCVAVVGDPIFLGPRLVRGSPRISYRQLRDDT